MTDSEPNDSEFPHVGIWTNNECEKWTIWEDSEDEVDTREKTSLQSSNWGKSLSLELVDKDCNLKNYNKRRLSDPVHNIHGIAEDEKSTFQGKKINKILNLLFMQMVTSESVPADSTFLLNRSNARVHLEKYFLKVLKALIKVLTGVINTPSESEILDYCGTVLLEVTADLDSATVVGYFLRTLQTNHHSFKHAAVALLSSYCKQRDITLTVIPHLLHRLVFLYIEVDQKILEYLWEAASAVIKRLKFSDRMKMLNDVCLAIKFSVCCVQERKALPGLCDPEGIAPILLLYEQAIFKGTMKDKKLAAKALQQLIVFATEDALKPYVCRIANVLIYNIKKYKSYTCYYQTQGVIVETVAHLIAKVGKLLNVYYPELKNLLLQTVNNSNKFLYIRSVTALCYLVHYCDKLDEFYEHMFYDIRDHSLVRVKVLHLLHYIIKHSCVEIPDNLRNRFIILASAFVSNDKEPVRIAAACCIGSMCRYFPHHGINKIVEKNFLDYDVSLCHLKRGRSLALMIALKEAPENILQAEYVDIITEKLVSYVTANDLEVVLNGVKACGYYILYKLQKQEQVSLDFLDTFCNAMNHSSEDVNHTFVLTVNLIARRVTLPLYVVQDVVLQLLNGLRKGSSRLHDSCQCALVAVFNLYKDYEIVEAYMNTLETKARESFEFSVLKDLHKLSSQPIPEEEDLDFTNLKQIHLK